MAIGANFDYITNLQYKVKTLTFQVQSFESGEKYVSMRSEFARQLAAKDMKIKKLKSELSDAYCEIVTVRKNWMQVFEDISNEHEKELGEKDRIIKKLEDQLLATQQKLDDTIDKLRGKNVELYQVKTELEEQKGANQQLKAQINRDYENSSIPSSQKPNHKKITNNREKTGRKSGGQPGHDGHRRKKHTPTGHIHIPAPDKYAGSDDYKPTGKTINKQVVNIGITVNVIEYDTPEFRNVHTGQRVHADFPDGVVNDVNYGGSVKAFAFLLNNRCGVSIDKVREFLSDMTDGELQISKENPDPDPDKVKEFENRYIEILELAKEEYEYEPPSNYYKDGYNVYKRLDEYRNSHLLFLHDIRIPTNNNLCKRKGRVFKRKQRQVMAFRSFDSLVYLCNSMSIIDMLSVKEDNLFKSVATILN